MPGLLKAWDDRADDQKFMVVCVAHNAAGASWMDRHAHEWASRQSLRLITVAEQYGFNLMLGLILLLID